jgi:hypothetical protein
MLPGASAESCELNVGPREKDKVAKRLCDYDIVFSQPHENAKTGPLAFGELQRRHSHVVGYPQIMFSGFHPDFIGGGTGTRVSSAARSYHSVIVAAAYANGIAVGEVGRLFNPLTFARLGYYKEYQSGKHYLLSKAQELGYDLKDDFGEWEAGGVFMHTPNHPAIHVLARVAARAAERAGLPTNGESTDDVDDRLGRRVRLPVYPAIAKRLKLDPKPNFRVQDGDGVRVFDLPEYISVTYEMYASATGSFFAHPRIQRVAGALREFTG